MKHNVVEEVEQEAIPMDVPVDAKLVVLSSDNWIRGQLANGIGGFCALGAGLLAEGVPKHELMSASFGHSSYPTHLRQHSGRAFSLITSVNDNASRLSQALITRLNQICKEYGLKWHFVLKAQVHDARV